MDRTMSMGNDSIDWGDMNFGTSDFPDSIAAGSPWGSSALNDFTNIDDYAESPVGLTLKNSRSGPDAAAAQRAQAGMPAVSTGSAESSSQDSASDSSCRRKRKTASASPMSDTTAEQNTAATTVVEPAAAVNEYRRMSNFGQGYGQDMSNFAVDTNMSDNGEAMFGVQSTASSPNFSREFKQQLSLDPNVKFQAVNPAQFTQESQTINPGMFTISGSRDQSPATNHVMFNTTSPNPLFSTPSSDSNEAYANANWNGNTGRQPSWTADFSNQFASPGLLGLTPSPLANGATVVGSGSGLRGVPAAQGRSPLHLAPISAKSRVETQINVVMTLERPPPGIEHLHLPLHTIAKSKLLAKEEYDPTKVLELHTMLVCTSAMHNPKLREKALQNATRQNNEEIQRRAEQQRESGEEDKNDPKNIPEEDRPSNGGEVRICPNCIQRERKRAGRKKLKREEEQQHWERYETERVVVFNSNEYLAFKPFDPTQQPQRDSAAAAAAASGMDKPYSPPEGAISVAAAMRIACYCRHQSEKEGFQVIITLKDHQGNVVAQQMTDSILITDDHKTHPSTMTNISNDVFYPSAQYGTGAHGLPHSHSMIDLPAHQTHFQTSRSVGNLQSLAYGQQYQSQSHVHHLPHSGNESQVTSATMTPTTLSRPASPSTAGQSGPNKKRKSSTFHRKVPSGLQMTPRVDTNQPGASNVSSAASTALPVSFSPTLVSGFIQQGEQPFMTMPQNSGPARYYNSGPSTPAAADAGQLQLGNANVTDLTRAQNASAYFSHPSSAVPSRSNSPVLQHGRSTMAALARQPPVQTSTNSIGRLPHNSMFTSGNTQLGDNGQPTPAGPIITKITPNEGPLSGGTEVSIFGYNFAHSTQVVFGDSVAPTTFYGPQCILATSPPGRRGAALVSLLPASGQPQQQQQFSTASGHQPIFTYKDVLDPQMMEMALRFLSQQQTGDQTRWMQYTNEVAAQFMRTSISPVGQQQGFGGGNVLSNSQATGSMMAPEHDVF